MNLLIPYVPLFNHPDPLPDEFTYGDVGGRARKLKTDMRKGEYAFFHTSRRGRKYITAYYVVDRVLDTAEAAGNRNIIAKYQNPHIRDYLAGKRSGQDDVVLFGDPVESRVLERPLLFDRTLADKLTLGIEFPANRTETQAIGSATRAWRQLTDQDMDTLLAEIKAYEEAGISPQTILSTDEVTEIIEKDLEGFIEGDPSLIGKSMRITDRQLETPVGRIDLLLESDIGDLVVVELKIGRIGRDAITQLRRYMDWLGKQSGKRVSGVVVCKGVMPAFEAELEQIENITILCYGWQLKAYRWSSEKSLISDIIPS